MIRTKLGTYRILCAACAPIKHAVYLREPITICDECGRLSEHITYIPVDDGKEKVEGR